MIDDLIRERLKKLEHLRSAGIDPYPAATERTGSMRTVLNSFARFSKAKRKVSVAGRVIGFRNQGNLFFVDLADESGQIQIVAKKDESEQFATIRDNLDLGDFLEVHGICFTTARGERSIAAKAFQFLAKAVRPLPSQWHGLTDQEIRFRKRYLDLLQNKDVKDLFIAKSRFWAAARKFLLDKNFIEVETPVLESIPGGADAEPFLTHHAALDMDFYLRISLEISLKKLMVGGFEKVFEIGRIFRNEGIDQEHLQDYTQLEFYAAYQDYRDLMKMIPPFYRALVKAAVGSLTTAWEGKKINWAQKWQSVDYYNAFKRFVGLDLKTAKRDELFYLAEQKGLRPERNLGRGRLIDLLFKKFVRPTLIQPTFLIDPPVDIEPLAKRSPKDPGRVERFQVVACGTELGKGFSELNDPLDQRKRFEEQMALRAAGDTEAQQLDEDFLEALEYGMPPTAGFGLSERLFAVFVGKPVRELVFFPPMKSKK